MKITQLKLDGVMLLEPLYFEDFRGYFCETNSKRTLQERLGINAEFKDRRIQNEKSRRSVWDVWL
jgi:dTDP-4-dehydrorhamnose 3,5-epimerase-like enzyme